MDWNADRIIFKIDGIDTIDIIQVLKMQILGPMIRNFSFYLMSPLSKILPVALLKALWRWTMFEIINLAI